jgi:flagellin-specific chaperone FliS
LNKIFKQNSDKSKEDLIRLIKDKLIKNIKKENKNINDDDIKKKFLNILN